MRILLVVAYWTVKHLFTSDHKGKHCYNNCRKCIHSSYGLHWKKKTCRNWVLKQAVSHHPQQWWTDSVFRVEVRVIKKYHFLNLQHVKHIMIQYDTIRYYTIRHDTIQYDTIRHDILVHCPCMEICLGLRCCAHGVACKAAFSSKPKIQV